jgi:mRNA-degrading endonuclease toxin of MazEF toxin-antitoxin module
MKQWDIWTCDFAEAGPHPAVIVSHPDRVARAPLVNVLIASSQRAGRPARENEVMLNGTDGLDWETLVKCVQLSAGGVHSGRGLCQVDGAGHDPTQPVR